MARRRGHTGQPSTYTTADAQDIVAWLDRAGGADALDGADSLTIRADVEWAGTTNPRPHRTLRADGLDLDRLAAAMRRPAADLPGDRLRSYQAQGWEAQMRALQATKAGRETLARELGVTQRTRQRWASGQHQPSPTNREAIRRAYEARATDPGAVQRSSAAHARRVANELSRALRERYGAEVRVTNISGMEVD